VHDDPVYLIEGDDPVLVNDKVTSLVRGVVGDDGLALGVEDYDAASTSPDSLVALCRTPPLFTARRAVVVRGVALWSSEAVEGLLTYVSAPDPSTTLVLVLAERRRIGSLSRD
jgi:DNA polymerase-3 subunit delta